MDKAGALTSGRGSRYVVLNRSCSHKKNLFFSKNDPKKKNRFILAGAEQLHEKIFQLSDRVRQLEDALEFLQSRCSNQPHPLLSPELLRIKTSQELYGTINPPNLHPPSSPTTTATATTTSVVDPSSNVNSRLDGNVRESVVALSLDTSNQSSSLRGGGDLIKAEQQHSSSERDPSPPEVAPDILQLSTTFPFPWMIDLSIRKRIRDSLPPKAEAQRICEEARANALWQ
jgi:hypothetical protein